MSSTDGPATRDKERTRRALLEAAGRLLSEQGSGLSLADVAAAAGVSKSGLLHHFPSRDALLLAVAADGLALLRQEVAARVDLAENRPGKLLRAYVRVLCEGGDAVRAIFAPSAALVGLLSVPAMDVLLQQDGEYWRRELAADGVSPERVLVVRLAAEGVAGAAGVPGYLTPEEVATARRTLLALSEG